MAKKRGKKPFKPTPKLRRDVQLYVFGGMSQDAIARVIGCSTPTLVKHFPEELATGAAKKEAEVLGFMYKAAKGGNVAAQKRLQERGHIAAAAKASAEGEYRPTPATTVKAGKKTLAAIAATTAGGDGTEWGDDLQVPDAPLN